MSRYLCKIDGCEKPRSTKGWCRMHYNRWHRHGDPLVTKTGQAKRYLSDVVMHYDGDDCLFWPYARDSNGYGCLSGNRRVHRMVCEAKSGPAPTPKHEAAHECGNGNKGCCAPSHLRWKTHLENMADMVRHGRAGMRWRKRDAQASV